MINLKLLRQNLEEIKNLIKKKDPSFDVDLLVRLDGEVVRVNKELELLQEKSNKIAETIKVNGFSESLKDQGKVIKKEIEKKKSEYDELYRKFLDLYLLCPNLPSDDLPIGNKEKNKVLRKECVKKEFAFKPLPYYDLKDINKFISFEIGAEIAKSGFPVYFGEIALIIHRLTNLFLRHNCARGFIPVIPPSLINQEALTAASNLPRFKDDVFCLNEDKLFLIPTSEVSLAYIHHDTIFNSDVLPARYTSLTNCFRREAGGYGSHERGIMRMHEFHKVEIFSFCKPEEANKEHEYMLSCAEELLQYLGLHYQVVLLATQDVSFASHKTYDIEVFFPGTGIYKEVSSVSNCGDFQSRRSKTRYRDEAGGVSLVNTLNGSSLAIPRVLVALLETHQNEKGEIDFVGLNNCIAGAEKQVEKNYK